jgi:hypothetical protein
VCVYRGKNILPSQVPTLGSSSKLMQQLASTKTIFNEVNVILDNELNEHLVSHLSFTLIKVIKYYYPNTHFHPSNIPIYIAYSWNGNLYKSSFRTQQVVIEYFASYAMI